jgi:hypothetical protein
LSASKVIGLLSALAGAVGTAMLYKGSFAFEAPAAYASPEFVAAMSKRNRNRQLLQRLGLALLTLSFVLAGTSIWID